MADRIVLESVLLHIESMMGAMIHRLTKVEAATAATHSPAAPVAVPHIQPRSPIGSATTPPRFADDELVHPVEFLSAMETYFQLHSISEQSWVSLTTSQLDDMPRDWAAAFADSWASWGEFKTAFLKLFWSEGRQDSLLYELQNTMYDSTIHSSMASFFVAWMKKIRLLSTPMPTSSFLRRVTHLLPSHVEDVVIAAQVRSEEDMLLLLRKLDSAATRRQDRCEVDSDVYQLISKPTEVHTLSHAPAACDALVADPRCVEQQVACEGRPHIPGKEPRADIGLEDYQPYKHAPSDDDVVNGEEDRGVATPALQKGPSSPTMLTDMGDDCSMGCRRDEASSHRPQCNVVFGEVVPAHGLRPQAMLTECRYLRHTPYDRGRT